MEEIKQLIHQARNLLQQIVGAAENDRPERIYGLVKQVNELLIRVEQKVNHGE